MVFADYILKSGSFIFNRTPFFRGLIRLYLSFNYLMLKIGANPIALAKMKDGTMLFVDLRSDTEMFAFYRGNYDSDLVQSIRSLLSPDSCFLDVGANIGFYTIAIAAMLKSQNGSGKVIAFEPFDGNYERLIKNISLNNLEGYCSTWKIGLSSAALNSEITLREDFVGGSETGNAAIPINSEFDKGFKRVPIKLDRLDNVWQDIQKSIGKIDVIKIDIEGHEDYCLEGGLQTIQTYRPIILMEVCKPYYAARSVELDEKFFPLIPKQYSIYRRSNGRWQIINSLNECDTIDNVFLVPEEKSGHFHHAQLISRP